MKTFRAICLSGASVFLICPSHGAISSYFSDFNGGATSVSNFYTASGGGAAPDFTWNATAGVGGGGGVLIGTSTGNKYYRPAPASDATSTFDFTALATGEGYRMTADFKWSNTTATDQSVINIGFVPGMAANMSSATSIGGSLIRGTGSTSLTLRLRTGTTNVETMNFNQSLFTAGDWYRLTYELVKTDTVNVFNGIVTLYSIGADGTSAQQVFLNGVTPATLSSTQTNADLYGDDGVFSTYDVRNVNGVSAVDNLGVSFIPEPTGVTLLGLGALGMMARRRRC